MKYVLCMLLGAILVRSWLTLVEEGTARELPLS